MIKQALFVRLEAKPGKEKELAQFLQTGLGMAQQETTTPIWFALQIGRTYRCARRQAAGLKPARKPITAK
jgi:hypothetical protein